MRLMILILSHFAQDITVVRLTRVLQDQGQEFLVLDPTAMGREVSLALDGQGPSCILRVGGRTFELSQLKSAWLWRSWQRFHDEPGLTELAARPADWKFFRAEWRSFHKSLVLALKYSNTFCVNPAPMGGAAEEKCGQLLVAAQCGLRIPRSLYTAKLSLAKEFIHSQGGKGIYKPFTSYVDLKGVHDLASARVARLYTNRVQEEDLEERDGLIPSPGIFQPYVEKSLELRIVVVGEKVFACAIHSQQNERGRSDWRRAVNQSVQYEPYSLPAEIEERLLLLMRRLQLVFGSVDMIVTPEGEYVFLEVNPAGQFDWIAHFGRLPIYECLAAMLVAGRTDYTVPAAHAA
ncbi:hypothetical protein JYJ95_22340 [Corallococcus exiguus]|nr:hypothetical protein [Corallococcus exiguus]